MSVLVTSSSDPMGALAAKPKYERQATTSSLDTGMAIKFRVPESGPLDPFKPVGTVPMTVQSSVTSTSSLTTGTTETESPRASSESTYQWDKPLDLSLGSSSVFSDWPMQALTLTTAATKSLTSLSSETSLTTPSLSRSPSPVLVDEHASPITPLTPTISTTSSPPTPTAIPIEQIHLHKGHFYYPPSSVLVAPPYKRGINNNGGGGGMALSRSSSRSSSLASFASSLSRKLSLRGSKDKDAKALMMKEKGKKRASEPVYIRPTVRVGNEASAPLHQQQQQPALVRRQTGPAITIAPPDAESGEVYRPSIQRLTARHVKSSLSRHPLARDTPVAAPSASSSPSSSSTSLASASSSNSALSSTSSKTSASSSSSRPSSSSGSSKVLKRMRSAIFPPVESSYSMFSPAFNMPAPSSFSASLPTNNLPAVGNGVKREGGLILPEPLGPDELDDNHLSIAWESQLQRTAREARIARVKAAKEAAARRLMQANMVHYRAPFMGF